MSVNAGKYTLMIKTLSRAKEYIKICLWEKFMSTIGSKEKWIWLCHFNFDFRDPSLFPERKASNELLAKPRPPFLGKPTPQPL